MLKEVKNKEIAAALFFVPTRDEAFSELTANTEVVDQLVKPT